MKDSDANIIEMRKEGRKDLIENDKRRLRDGEAAEYSFIPLDLPRLEVDLKLYLSMCNDPLDTYYARAFKYLRLRDLNGSGDKMSLTDLHINQDGWDWNDTAHSYFPDVASWCDEHLPMDNLTFVSLVSSVMHLGPHLDDFSINSSTNPCEPAHYRALISGPVGETMYATRQWYSEDIPESLFHEKKYRFMELPEDTNSFVMNMRDSYHGSRFKGPKLVLLTTGFVNQEKHEALIKRSVEKYPEYVIRVSELED